MITSKDSSEDIYEGEEIYNLHVEEEEKRAIITEVYKIYKACVKEIDLSRNAQVFYLYYYEGSTLKFTTIVLPLKPTVAFEIEFL